MILDPQPSSTALSTMTPESETTPPSAVTDDGEAQIRSNPSGLQYKEGRYLTECCGFCGRN
jgi:hypothetical protein